MTGALLYCVVNTTTRPDVNNAVGMLCRAMNKPTPQLVEAAYQVLFYLHHHKHVGLHYSACDLDLSGMSDADWASGPLTTRLPVMFSPLVKPPFLGQQQ